MEDSQLSLKPQLGLFVAARVLINASYRMIYPFLRIFASGLGVTLQVSALPLTGRSLVGVLAPLMAPVSDRFGRKVGMLLGLGLFCLGMLLVALWPSFSIFFIGLTLANLGNLAFLPAMQAYLGDRVPYKRRGAVLALTEMSWSLSYILLVPLAGLLIASGGWTAPFGWLSGLGLLLLGLVALLIPRDAPHSTARAVPFWGSLRGLLQSPLALYALSFSMAITMANEVVNLVFGVWMNDAFQLDIASLGLAATVIGLAELSGESASAGLVDRIGKKRAVGAGLILTSLAALALPVLARSLWSALLGLFLFYLGFEFTLVCFIPVMTELMPQARATLMAANLTAFSLGRAFGALLGPMLYAHGFGANTAAALALNLLAIFLLSRVKVVGEQ